MRAAIAAAHQARVARVVVAVPVAANETCRAMQREVDEMVCLITPICFQAVGQWYEEFSQTSDEEVHELLVRAALPPPESPGLPHRVSGNHA
jgi:predicted phosphoribosyltransferase